MKIFNCVEKGCDKLALHIGCVVVGMTWGLSPNVVAWLESGAEKSPETVISLAADGLFGNNWWYAFNTNVSFRGYVNVATLTFVHKTRRQTGG
jgi:hypothetical protein